MDIYNYLIPNETPLKFVVALILCGLISAIWLVFNEIRKCNIWLAALDDLRDVSLLKSAIGQPKVDKEEIFNKYSEEKGFQESKKILFDHLKSIYSAGCNYSKLDVDILLKNTKEKLFKNNEIIRTIVSLFLVVGILGTLLGLAMSLGSLSSVELDTLSTSQTRSEMVGGLGRLFTRLKSAFAPSIWGVLSTIIGMAIFTGYQAKFCAKLDNKLTILTLDVWVANLNQSSIIKSETSMKNLEATIKNADAINDGASLLLDNLTLSNSTLQEFSKTSELLNNASERFALGSDKILSFQEGLQTLYGQMKENNDRMSNYISTSVNATSEFQNNSFNNLAEQTKQMGITFQQQNEQIRTLFENLKMYEENYLERQSQYIKNLTELTEASKIALDSIKRSKDDVVAAVGDPLRNELMMKLAEINSNLGKVGNPLSETAEIMQNMLENVIRNFEEKTNQITAQNVNTNLVQKLDQLIDIIAQKDGNNAEDKLPVINDLQAEKFPNPKPVDIDNSVITSRLDRLIEVLEKQKQTSDNNSLVVDRLNQLINISENQQTISVETPKSEKVWLRFVPAAIAILMFVSLLVQVHINSRIGTLQESQQTKVVQSMPINKN